MNAENIIVKQYKLQIIIMRVVIITWLVLNILFPQITIASELTDDLQYLLSSEPTINYEDPKLKQILDKYEYRIFRAYKAFVEFDKSSKSMGDVIKAKKELLDYCDSILNCKNDNNLNEQDTIDAFLSIVANENIASDLPHKKRRYVTIPLWLVLKYPGVLNYNWSMFGPCVNYNFSIHDLDAFNKFTTSLSDATDGYWRHMQGTMYRYQFAGRRHYMEQISFAPSIFFKRNYSSLKLEDEIKKSFEQLELWSYQGIWNMLKYKKILQYFYQASDALSNYYNNNYGLKEYAPYTKLILAQYIGTEVPKIDISSDGEFHYYNLIEQIKPYEDNLDKLKEITKKFDDREKGYLLFYSVVKNSNIEFIQWLMLI